AARTAPAVLAPPPATRSGPGPGSPAGQPAAPRSPPQPSRSPHRRSSPYLPIDVRGNPDRVAAQLVPRGRARQAQPLHRAEPLVSQLKPPVPRPHATGGVRPGDV